MTIFCAQTYSCRTSVYRMKLDVETCQIFESGLLRTLGSQFSWLSPTSHSCCYRNNVNMSFPKVEIPPHLSQLVFQDFEVLSSLFSSQGTVGEDCNHGHYCGNEPGSYIRSTLLRRG